MAAPDFSKPTSDILAFRSGLICNNPECSTLTVGPSDAQGDLKLKLGEAAHISGARPTSARYDASLTDDKRASVDNGIWLCANCHSMIDKNQGADFTEAELRKWQETHESVISSLLRTHRSPFPILRRFTQEVPAHVTVSVEQLRRDLINLNRMVKLDTILKALIKDLAGYCRDFMNHSGRYNEHAPDELNTLRNRVGVALGKLQRDYGCTIRGPIIQIII
ncbi:MAG: hypothetical protein RhofKO_12530 [Rhodothermales bacterium]